MGAAPSRIGYNDFEIVAANLLEGEARKLSDRIPSIYALFIDPLLDRVGMPDAEARANGGLFATA